MRHKEKISYGRGLAVSTVRGIKGGLNTAFNYAVKAGIIPSNPVSSTTLPAKNKSSATSMTLDEAWAFVAVKDSFWYGFAFVFQLHTGLRPQELMGLIWDDIDFIKGTVRVERACKWLNGVFSKFGPPKSFRGYRTIELDTDIIEMLKIHLVSQQKWIENFGRRGETYGDQKIQEWLSKEKPNEAHLYKNTNLIFPMKGGRIPNMRSPHANFKAMLRRAGITRKIRWYDLRHTNATFLLILGVPDYEVAARLGHTTAELQKTYTHLLEGRQRIASKLLASIVPAKGVELTPSDEVKKLVYEYIGKSREHLKKVMLGA